MPAADGAHLLRRVRDTEGLARTPVLVMTGYGTGAPTLTLAQGADAYEPKPVEPESLLASVRRLLSGGGD
jgi:CheY-like chemotaxis protein